MSYARFLFLLGLVVITAAVLGQYIQAGRL